MSTSSEKIEEMFSDCESDYLQFNQVENPEFSCPDLCGMSRLLKLAPIEKGKPMVSAEESGQIYFSTDVDEFCKNATQDDVLYLCRCGISFDRHYESFSMYV